MAILVILYIVFGMLYERFIFFSKVFLGSSTVLKTL